MKKKLSCAIGILFLFGSACTYADTLLASSPRAKMEGDNKIIALYGNSFTFYNNNINTRLRDLSRSLLADHARGYQYRGITISSGRLGWQIDNLAFQNTLQKWDVVILQGNSMEPISKKESTRQNFVESATKMADMAHKAGSKVVYFMTWPGRDKPEDGQKLADAYLSVAQKTGGYVAPVGLAFDRASKTHPEINLYYHDGVHPSMAGTYLAACVFFATLYNQSPVGGALPVDTDMTPETAKALQQIAWETVTDFQKPSTR
ncbi:hypothetical protein C3432_13475 [Citrobacter amalonaticus]|uniref:SGNH/GDSL hydrolase family protein n=1 Tax=Citrobacter amalonaticus TaxID=35703 RepID=A0A2S4RW09_CITAM|nr:DUF4886 domain-containing protein [Citrobacter amalonaticus]POT56429.1 hypothetical protein C3432_13475 [Citrobacter amalonaticus]POT74954.1 hypothetical protein C3436_13945 [Citrobacter amalonaticus]POU64483.1 hypothetical protein C3430_14965 [Citrobacter amalonaticus]POV04319.1 hypothetical protein C3424_14285 [Citrobacter amalonaticus]